MPARTPTGPTPPRRSGPARRATPKRDQDTTAPRGSGSAGHAIPERDEDTTPPRGSGSAGPATPKPDARRAAPKGDGAAVPVEPGSKRPRGAFGATPAAGIAAAAAAGAEPAADMAGESTPKPPWVEWTMRIAGTLVGVALGFVTAIYEVYLIPLRLTSAGHARVPVAVLVAIVANAGLVWFTRAVTGRVGPALLPGIPWLLVMLVAGNETADGDLLITGNNWVGVATILCGAVAWAVAGYKVILRAKRGPLPPKE